MSLLQELVGGSSGNRPTLSARDPLACLLPRVFLLTPVHVAFCNMVFWAIALTDFIFCTTWAERRGGQKVTFLSPQWLYPGWAKMRSCCSRVGVSSTVITVPMRRRHRHTQHPRKTRTGTGVTLPQARLLERFSKSRRAQNRFSLPVLRRTHSAKTWSFYF